MVVAPVGHHCPDCVARAGRAVRRGRPPWARAASRAPVTMALVALNVAVWVAVLVTGGDASPLVGRLALLPTSRCAVGADVFLEVPKGACATASGVWLPGLADGGYWQLLTSAFLHVSVVHLVFNMLALLALGPQLEQALGRTRYVTLYLLSACAGGVAVYWLSDPATTTLGASGAIFGLMGALATLAWRHQADLQPILIWLGANVAFTFLAGPLISWQGHLGGLAGGALVAMLFVAWPRRTLAQGLGALAVAVTLAALVLTRTLALT